jgi:hypothetical protein
MIQNVPCHHLYSTNPTGTSDQDGEKNKRLRLFFTNSSSFLAYMVALLKQEKKIAHSRPIINSCIYFCIAHGRWWLLIPV